MPEPPQGLVRIGELSRRTGLSADQLRAWERRYALLRPARSPGGFRLYSADDERRVGLMKGHMARGLSAAEAARLALVADELAASTADGSVEALAAALSAALERYDEAAAQEALDAMLSRFSAETVLRDALIPYLHALGAAWACGDIGVHQEHYASNVLAGRMFGLARGWDRGVGPRALLACAPEELHTLGLVAFGIALRGRGWRIAYLGADTPIEALARSADALEPDLVVVTAVTEARLARHAAALRTVAKRSRLVLAGAGASAKLCRRVGAEFLDADPVTAAEQLEPAQR
jgi:MerR family transcriptional regulator, light-induced transcriptional regulator